MLVFKKHRTPHRYRGNHNAEEHRYTFHTTRLVHYSTLMRSSFRAIVSGRVQMVMYRDFASRKAHALGVFGTVKNLSDGTVEVVAEGKKEVLESFIEKLKSGPVLARVDDVSVSWQQPSGTFSSFIIEYT